ncbi:MAG: glycosyltransferase family 39 protein [Chthoniobacterales bacterium]
MKTRLFLILAVLTVLRLLICGRFELSPDEAYYYQWSQHPDLAYYSKGPGVAMTILASTKLFGATEFGVRALSPLLGLGTSLLVFGLARRIYDERAGFWAAILTQCLPIFNIGALLMTIDPLSIFFWLLGVYSFWRAIEVTPRWSPWWLLSGLAVGLGSLAKYTNLAALLSMAAVISLVPAWRIQWRRLGIYLALLIAALCMIPPVLWNNEHDWITLTHLSERGNLETGFALHPEEPFKFLGEHLGVYSPLILIGLGWSFFAGLWNFSNHRKTAFLISFAAPLIFLYFGLSLKEAGEANWTAPAMVTLAIFATRDWLRRFERKPWFRIWARAALVLGVFISLLAMGTEPLRKMGIHWPYEYDAGTRLQGWTETGKTVAEVRREVEAKTGGPVFLIANKYQVAASLAWYLPEKPVMRAGDPPVYIPESQMIQNQYSFWPSYDTFDDAAPHELDPFNTEEAGVNRFMGKNALYVTDRAEGKPAEALMRGFERWEYFGEREITKNGLLVRKIRFFICTNYKTLPL